MSDASTSSFLLYGVCAAEAQADAALQSVLRQQTGVGGASLSLWAGDALALLRSPVTSKPLRAPDTATVLTYREVVAAAYAVRPLVPLQFGTQVDTDEQGQALMARHRAALQQHLDRFEGRVEVGVRLTLAESAPAEDASSRETTSGRAYLEARRDERARKTARESALLESYRAAIGSGGVDTHCSRTSDQERILSLSFLVPQSESAAIMDRLAAVEAEGVKKAHVVGPWAPYSFVSL